MRRFLSWLLSGAVGTMKDGTCREVQMSNGKVECICVVHEYQCHLFRWCMTHGSCSFSLFWYVSTLSQRFSIYLFSVFPLTQWVFPVGQCLSMPRCAWIWLRDPRETMNITAPKHTVLCNIFRMQALTMPKPANIRLFKSGSFKHIWLHNEDQYGGTTRRSLVERPVRVAVMYMMYAWRAGSHALTLRRTAAQTTQTAGPMRAPAVNVMAAVLTLETQNKAMNNIVNPTTWWV